MVRTGGVGDGGKLTSEATLLSKNELKLAGLVEHQLPRPLGESDQKRWLFVTPEIDAVLSDSSIVPTGWTDAKIGSFLKGHVLLVTRQRNKKRVVADFKKLEGHDEAWVMVFPQPKDDQWRLFGRFASKDVFVGLLLLPRKECGSDERYQERAEEMIATWKFASEPLRSDSLEDYFSGHIISKDDK